MSVMQTDDEEDGLDYEKSYYLELTELLYSQYDVNGDGALTLKEWHDFARDILDESTPQYRQLLTDPKLGSHDL
jgi:hypothetical protein